MTDDANAWNDPAVAAQQRALVDQQLEERPWPAHFTALAEAVRATNCPGDVLEFGCASGYGREVLDRAGVPYRYFTGLDISDPALEIARERYPESRWKNPIYRTPAIGEADIVVDGSCVLHVDNWQKHLRVLCETSRRWVILHRIPLGERTVLGETKGYDRTFRAWTFEAIDIRRAMAERGFHLVASLDADGDSKTLTFALPRQFVSYFDTAYWPRARVMHSSLLRHLPQVEMHALCWDYTSHVEASGAGMRAVHIDDFLAQHRDLHPDELPGPDRTRVEHMWTCGPRFIADVARRTYGPVTYVDADVMFHSSPEPLFGEWDGAAAGIVPHGFPPAKLGLPGPTLESHRVFGKYNVGIVHVTKPVAEDWADKCREWCYDAVDRGRYGDQAYLDLWPVTFDAIATEHPGACLGPWAVHTRALDVRDGVIHFGDRPLIAYHYSALKLLPHGDGQLTRPEYALTRRQEHILYAPYLRALENARP